jgi:arylsulfatase
MPDRLVTKRCFLKAASGAALWTNLASSATPRDANPRNPERAQPPMRGRTQTYSPNIVLICADDLGYGDLGCYGSRIPTPNIDKMAAEGVRLSQCYSASPVCSPSRASLLTGRYPTRVGVPGVLFPSDHTGLPESETTVAQLLKYRGYRTACIGKWHIGSRPPYLPTDRGFDEYFGLPYSNDMGPSWILRNTQVVDDRADLGSLGQRYTEEAVRFIGRSTGTPFFLYLAPHAPHIPLLCGSTFRGTSGLGPYGDSVAELDWGVGEVLRALADNSLDRNTLVVVTSDNGPWYQGSTGGLRGRKGETYEGGVRVPFVAQWPGRIPPGLVANGVASLMDLLPTVAGLCSAPLPPLILDGLDIWPMLSGEVQEIERNALLYFDRWHLQCARFGRWKLHISRYNSVAWTPAPAYGRMNLPLSRPELYDLEADPQESCDIASYRQPLIQELRARIEGILDSFPTEVGDAWRETMSREVEESPSGALPQLKNA